MTFLVLVVPLLYSIILHEVAHGVVALWFGDPTAKRAGRLTLNPVPHIDPLGALMLLFVGFGWARPVPVNYAQLNKGKAGMIAVALSGCLTNIALAAFFVFLLQFPAVRSNGSLATICATAAQINIVLGAFNLIPIPPLDGSRVATAFLPRRAQMLFARFERIGFFLILALLYTGLLSPAIRFIEGGIYQGIALLFGAH